jgi:hypothetical protein
MAFGAAIATASLAGCKGDEPAIGAEESAARPDTETRSAPAEEDRRRPGSAEKDDTAPIKSPFLVGAEPPPLPQETARPVVVPPVNTVKRPQPDITRDQKRWNQAKPYGAPPADGLPEIV